MRGSAAYHKLGRRDLVVGSSLALVACRVSSSPSVAPGPTAPRSTPLPMWGVQSGDVSHGRAVVWSRSDRPARMLVEWDNSPAFASPRRVRGPAVSAASDLTGKVVIDGLPAAARVHYRVRFEAEAPSEWITGALTTPAHPEDRSAPRDVLFAWSGDTNGQGWGIDPARGGMPAFTALLARRPDFFISCGDAIYADDRILPERAADDGTVWRNLVTPAKSHIAETLDDFRGAHLYSRHSREVRAFAASVATFWIWDDHEVRNNWFPGEVLSAQVLERSADAGVPRREPRLDVLATHARRAMIEHWPTLLPGAGPGVMYRSVAWGPLLEVFYVDGRSYRSANHPAPPEGAEAYFGATQLAWLEGALVRSKATWKVIACNMPVALVISEPAPDGSGATAFDAFANDSASSSGRELELAHLFATLRARHVHNVVWLTADVHYAAAHRFDPSRAAFKDLDPFWEFVAGPMHASSFPRKRFDDTFGPELAYASAGWNSFGSPASGEQYFGTVGIDGRSEVMTVTLVDAAGHDLHETVLTPRR